MVYVRPDTRYPKNWNKLRWAIFKEYGYICQRCGRYSKGNLELHHIKPIGFGGSNSKDNLIPLCRECHAEMPSSKIAKRKRKK